MLTEDQKKERRLGIGGSDVAAILGLKKNFTPFQVFLEKTGQWERPEFDYEDNPRADWGNRLEDPVAKKFSEKTGLKVYESKNSLVHPEYSFMRANIDRLIEGEVGEDAFLECKTAASDQKDFWGETGSSKLPREYALQVMHYCAVLNKSKAYIAVLIGGHDFRILEYTRNLDAEKKLIEIESNFWNNHVLQNIPPQMMNIDDMKISYFLDSIDQPIMATPETYALVENYIALRNEIKLKEGELEVFKLKILENMKNHDVLTDAHGGVIATYRAHGQTLLNMKKAKEILTPEQYEECLIKKEIRTFRTKKIETE